MDSYFNPIYKFYKNKSDHDIVNNLSNSWFSEETLYEQTNTKFNEKSPNHFEMLKLYFEPLDVSIHGGKKASYVKFYSDGVFLLQSIV